MKNSTLKKIMLLLNVAVLAAIITLDVLLIKKPSLALKSSASACFVLGAVINLAYAVTHGGKKSFISLMLIGCVFAMAGDIVNYQHGQLYFIVGTALFAVAHVFYLAAYYCLYDFHIVDLIVSAVIFVPSVLFITLAPMFDFGGALMEVVCAVYALILSCMVGKALANLRKRTALAAVIAGGSILFYISDLSLLINMFSTVDSTVPRILCLATYYPAQFLLAFAVALNERGMHLLKAVYCRVFQFVLKIALPLLPYKDPKIIDKITDIPEMLESIGKHNPLIVTDKTVHGLGLIASLEESLKQSGIQYELYDGVVANPTTANVSEALELYKNGDCDCLVAVGGGSPMDCAKGVGALVAKPGKTLGALRGILKVGKKIPTLIAVPTTAGTGSETTLAAVIVDSQTRHKYAINDFPLIPSYAVLDESITATLPKRVVSTTGMDALTHAVEAYIGRGGNKSTRADALDATKLIFENIENAYEHGTDEARRNMLIASHKAGRAFSKAYVGYVHALAHALGGKYDTPHGLANAVILPVVLEEYGSRVHKKLCEIAVYCGLVESGANAADGAKALIARIKELNKKFDIPEAFTELNAGDIVELSRYADREANPLYPVPALWDEYKLAAVYRKLVGDKTQPSVQAVVEMQKKYFASGKTLDVEVRVERLKALQSAIRNNLALIHDGLYKDLGKSDMESYTCETGLALSELDYMLKHVRKWSKPRRVPTPIVHIVSKSYRQPSPFGTTLIMSPWNYPFLLSIDPLIDAVAAGNTVVLKLSRNAPNTAKAIKQVVESVFPPEYVAVLEGGSNVNDELMNQKFDYVFFTGSTRVGKMIYENAARTLTPVTLELGGKSPCIVDETANIKLAAKRIVWGKFLNLGQTCVAPDYIFCHESVHDKLIDELKKQIEKQFPDALNNPLYGKMISAHHFERVNGLIDASKVAVGGRSDANTLKIEPTVLDNVAQTDAVMQEEIFGPVLPVMTYSAEKEVTDFVAAHNAPLAMYVFSSNKKRIKRLIRGVGFGGGCVNDVVVHLATPHMAFGGYGASGLGSYHGKSGFDAFTHYKSIMDKWTGIDLPLRYRPNDKFNETVIKMFMK